ncbi:hypothetical protein [Methanobrevibacter sp.]|uniref:hypothetical protein n=1 Tax=Methanobrevibacter sp. TaxID=66852 RepID=UPI00388DC7AD
MNKNHIIIIILVIIIVALIALISAPFIFNDQKDDVVIYNNTIDDVGSFNTVNVTNFTLDDEDSDGEQTFYLANDTITQVSLYSRTSLMENTIADSDRVNDSPEGHTIYKTTANMGAHKGEVRYITYLTDNEKERHIQISSPDYNLTCMMVDSFKMF